MGSQSPRVTVIGAGQTGRGWSAMLIAAGWHVVLFDANTGIATRAEEEVRDRVRRLVRMGLANDPEAASGLGAFRVGRSLLQAAGEAEWVLEAGPEDLTVKQRLLEHIEQVVRAGAVITSTSSYFHASGLCARLRHPEQLLVTHAMTPVELFPIVEVVPGPLTDPERVVQIRYWLRQLHRFPIVLAKEVPGNLLGRLRAAMWRETIHLLLEGVAGAEDLDRAIEHGPALWWAAAGPHHRAILGAEPGDLEVHLSKLLGKLEPRLEGLATWTHLSPDERHRLVRLLARAYPDRPISEGSAVEEKTVSLLNALRRLE